MMKPTEVTAGPKGAIIHVNRQFIAMNAKDGGNRPVYTIKPDGPNSKAIYARQIVWEGASRAVHDGSQLACGARAWIAISPGVVMILDDAMPYTEAKAA